LLIVDSIVDSIADSIADSTINLQSAIYNQQSQRKRRGTGLANFIGSIGTFGWMSVNTTRSRPSSHEKVQRNGSMTPATGR